jgi:hypothetical protein
MSSVKLSLLRLGKHQLRVIPIHMVKLAVVLTAAATVVLAAAATVVLAAAARVVLAAAAMVVLAAAAMVVLAAAATVVLAAVEITVGELIVVRQKSFPTKPALRYDCEELSALHHLSIVKLTQLAGALGFCMRRNM